MNLQAEASPGDDLSALAWVQAELRRSLESAHKALRRYVREVEGVGGSDVDSADPSVLRSARVQIHQGVGALELVALPGVAQVLRASEAAVQRLVARPKLATPEAVNIIEQASFAVLDFLARTLAGKPVPTLALFPQYAAVQALAGAERVHPADLWPHDWQWRPLPADARVTPRAADDSARSEMEGLALALMRGGDPAAPLRMSDLCAELGAGARDKAATLWHLAAAFFEAKAGRCIRADVYTKRVASRLLAQLRSAIKGDTAVSNRLAQDLLFFCVRAELRDPTQMLRLAAVQAVWPGDPAARAVYDTASLGLFDPAMVQQARKRVAGAKDAWSAVAGGESQRVQALTESFALLADSLQRLFPNGEMLARAMQATAARCAQTQRAPGPEHAMEVATAMLYVDAVLEDGELDRPELGGRVQCLAQRITDVGAGGQAQPLERWMEELYRRISDRQTMGSVVQELRNALTEVEKQIDQYFRNPAQCELLFPVPAQLSAMRGVLKVLGLEQAAQAVVHMRDTVDVLAQTEMDPQRTAHADTFDRLADNLGALSFLIDMLSVQPELAKTLFRFDPASGTLSAVMAQTGRTSRLPAFKPTAPVPSTQERAADSPAASGAAPVAAPPPAPPPAPMPSGLEDDAEMREVFLEEAREGIAAARASLVRLAQVTDDLSEMTNVRRAFHTLKGSSRMVGLKAFGEAAWGCEQLYNARLAQNARMDAPLAGFSTQALDYLADWVEAIASGIDRGHEAAAVTLAADALREQGRELAIAPPVLARTADADALEADATTPGWDDEPLPEVPSLSERVPDLPAASDLDLLALDIPQTLQASPGGDSVMPMPALLDPIEAAVQGLEVLESTEAFESIETAEATPLLASADDWAASLDLPEIPQDGAADAPHAPTSRAIETPEFTLDLAALEAELPDDGAPTYAPVQELPAVPGVPDPAAAGPGLPLQETVEAPVDLTHSHPAGEFAAEMPLEAPSAEVVEMSAEAFDSEFASEFAPGFSPSEPGGDAAAAGAALPTLTAVEPALPDAPALPEVPESAVPEPLSALGAEPAALPDDEVKVVGPLRIPIPLFNIFLNEADEQSRRLGVEIAEWTLEPHQPVAETSVALAHSLAGNSATVGFGDLSALARTLEHALMRSRAIGHASDGEPVLFTEAAEEIRRLLHQFAAGFLRPMNEALMARLLDHEVATSNAERDTEWPLAAEDEAPAALPNDADDALAAAQAGGDGEAGWLAEVDAMDAIDGDLFPIFEEEADELLPQLRARLSDWMRHPGDAAAALACMRTLHTFKGGARLAGAMRLGELAHRLETEIEALTGREGVDAAAIERLLARADTMATVFERLRATPIPAPVPPPPTEAPERLGGAPMLADEAQVTDSMGSQAPGRDMPVPAASSAERPAVPGAEVAPAPIAMPRRIDWARFPLAMPSAAPVEQAAEATPGSGAAATVRVRAPLLDRLVNQAGEVSITRARIEAEMRTLQGSLGDLTDNLEKLRRHLRDIELQAETQISSRMEAARAAAEVFDPLEMDRFTRFQELTRTMAESVNDVATVHRGLQRALQASEDELAMQARLTRELQGDLLRTRMVEFESLADRLYRVVRLAAKEAGKSVRLDIVGGSIEVDRGVLERMVGPFEHLLRNAVAHGIEAEAGRRAAGKPDDGLITITTVQDGNEVAVEVRDDGAGLDLALIRARAVERGLIAPDATPTDAEVAQLIFVPGFSTADTITGLAGRGVGMDVVRAEVLAMGGRIETDTRAGHGTAFRLSLPLTTAVTQVVMLRCGEREVAVPSTLVEVVRREKPAVVEASYASGRFAHDGEEVPFYWLGALLQAAGPGAGGERSQTLVVLRSAAQRVVVHVDEVAGNQEVVVKNVGPQLSRLPGLAGVTLLPSGAVAAIYNPVALAAVYGEDARARMQAKPQAEVDTAGQPPVPLALSPLVMVVDDSLTVRRVTQRLLAREGYRVVLAKDGMDALERLAEERPAVLLSDIEMPRMDGFDLVRNVRADPRLASLPVIMITSRIAQKHRDYAAELGVEHYLGKPYSEDELLGLVARHVQADIAI